MHLFKWLAANTFNMVGALLIAIGIPLPYSKGIFFENPLSDFVLLAPIGLLFLGISYYYAFIDKTWKR